MATEKDKKAPQYRDIFIIPTEPHTIAVEKQWRLLSKSNAEQARWFLFGKGKKFTVRFDKGDGTPFKENEFSGAGVIVSGPIVVDVEDPPKAYRYSVEVDGYGRVDPGVIVW